MFHYAQCCCMFIESKLISFIESSITREHTTWCILCQPSSHCDGASYTMFGLYTKVSFSYRICIDSI